MVQNLLFPVGTPRKDTQIMKLIRVTILLLMALPYYANAVPGMSIGAKIGKASYSGDILPNSGDVGSSVFYGFILDITAVPALDFEVQANYFAKDFRYKYDLAGVPQSVDFEFRDVNVILLAKKNIFSTPGGPISFFVGGGVGLHLLNTELAQSAVGGSFNPAAADNPFSLFANNSKTAGHGAAGIKLTFPASPLSLYGQGRYGRIFAGDGVSIYSVEAGLLLGF